MSNGLVTDLRFLVLHGSSQVIPPVVASDPKSTTIDLFSEAVGISGRSFSIPVNFFEFISTVGVLYSPMTNASGQMQQTTGQTWIFGGVMKGKGRMALVMIPNGHERSI